MTYEDYKNKKGSNKNRFIKNTFNKIFTCIIFTMIILIMCNYSSSFKNFIINDVLNNTMDFSIINRITNKLTNFFHSEETLAVSSDIVNYEEYLDGIKYKVDNNSEVNAFESGIVTFIGKKEGYNNTIIIQQSNGYTAWYGNVKESIKLYDFIEKGSVIGSASNEYYYALFKDDKKVNINEN